MQWMLTRHDLGEMLWWMNECAKAKKLPWGGDDKEGIGLSLVRSTLGVETPNDRVDLSELGPIMEELRSHLARYTINADSLYLCRSLGVDPRQVFLVALCSSANRLVCRFGARTLTVSHADGKIRCHLQLSKTTIWQDGVITIKKQTAPVSVRRLLKGKRLGSIVALPDEIRFLSDRTIEAAQFPGSDCSFSAANSLDVPILADCPSLFEPSMLPVAA